MKAWSLEAAMRAPERITELYITGRKLRTLSVDFRPFVRLRKLDLSNNCLQDLPSTLADVPQLESLVLSGNSFSQLPQVISECLHLKELVIDSTYITHLPLWLARLPALNALWANGCPLGEWPEVVGQLKQLRVLGLGACGLKSISSDVIWPVLEKLDLSANQLKRLPPVTCRWRALRQVNLNNNHLRQLDLSGWKQLETLSVAYNRLRLWPTGLAQLSRLRYLDLSNNQLRLADAPEQLHLPQLRQLLLARNKLNAPPPFVAYCAMLRQLDLSYNALCAWPQSHCVFPHLETLTLAGTPLQKLPNGGWELPWLRQLGLRRSALEHLPKEWLPMPRLKEASLTERLWQVVKDELLQSPMLERVTGIRRAPSVNRFLTLCHKHCIEAAVRPLLWRIVYENSASWEELPLAQWWRCLDWPGRLGHQARMALLARYGTHELPEVGACWWLAGRLRRGVRYWQQLLIQQGMVVRRQWQEEVTHVLVGHQLPDLPPLSQNLVVWTEERLTQVWASYREALSPVLQARLVRLLRAGQVRVALPLLEHYRWEEPLPTAVLFAWWQCTDKRLRCRLSQLLRMRLGVAAHRVLSWRPHKAHILAHPPWSELLIRPFDAQLMNEWMSEAD